MKPKLSPKAQALFRQAMKGVKPLKAKQKVEPELPPPPRKRRTPLKEEETIHDDFSDHEYLDPVDTETPLFFARPSLSAKIVREFRRGLGQIEARLDLHGQTVEEARGSLARFLLYCQQESFALVLVIHGKGRGSKLPILKNKLNHWLRQSEQVLAFCSAKPNHGGNGALYLRLKR